MRDRRGGFILISALAVLAVLAGLVGSVALLVRAAAADAGVVREELTRQALERAGVELAAYQTLVLRRPLSDMTEQRIRFDSGSVTLTVFGEAGKIDLNGASPELLAGLWRMAGTGGMSPESFADRVIDWRDKDFKKTRAGAEAAEYESAGVQGPANAPFDNVDDVQRVLGVGPAGALALKPYVTVANPNGQLSAAVAPRETLRAVPKIQGVAIDRLLKARRSSDPEALQKAIQEAGVELSAESGTAFEVRLAVETGGRVTRSIYRFLLGRDRSALFKVFAREDLPAS